jgi:hypothetical protein
VSRGRGIIRDPEIHRRTLGEVASALEAAGAAIIGSMPSPITGSAGNVEYLLHARTNPGAPPTASADPHRLTAVLDDVVAEAHAPGRRG